MEPGKRLGHYEILCPLGSGGMGAVYRARDHDLDRDVAIKILAPAAADDPELLARFEREAKLLAAANHPNIATIYGVERSPDGPYLVMEVVEGGTLAERLHDGPLSIDEALRIGAQIARGVEAAHTQGIVHRDLKPANVALLPDGRVKLLDFGIAKSLAPGAATTRPDDSETGMVTIGAEELTAVGAVVGTVPYMSPEQVRGQPVDERSDNWAFGCVLYELLAGQRAFAARTPADTMSHVLERDPDWEALPEATPRSIRRLLGRCLHKDPEQRLHSIADARIEIDQIRAGSPALEAGPAPRRWRRGAMALAMVAGAVLLVLALDTFGPRGKPTNRDDGADVGALAAATQIGSLVALPAAVVGPEAQTYLTDAVPRALSAHLSALSDLEVRLPPSGIVYERAGGDPDLVAESYDVDALLVSTVIVRGAELVLQIQLVGAQRQTILWTGEVSGNLDTYLATAAAAASAVAAAVRPGEPIPGAAVGSNSDTELLFRQGQYFLERYNYERLPEDFDKARTALEQAFAAAPTADIAATRAFLEGLLGETDPAAVERSRPIAREWVDRALELDPETGLAWSALAAIEQMDPSADWRQVFEHALRGARLAPDQVLTHNMIANVLLTHGLLSLSLPVFERMTRLYPLYSYGWLNMSWALQCLGRTEEEVEALSQAERLQPESPVVLAYQAEALSQLGQLEQSAAYLDRLEQKTTEGRYSEQLILTARLSQALAEGDRPTGDRLVREIMTFIRIPEPNVELVEWFGGIDLLLLRHGYRAEARDLLAAGLATNTLRPYESFEVLPELIAIREDPEFATIVAGARANRERALAALEAARDRGDLPDYLVGPVDQVLREWHERDGN